MNDHYLAIDIGTSSIKAVEKDSSGRAIRWGVLERRGKPFQSNIQPLDIDDVARNLKLLIEKMKPLDKPARPAGGLGEYNAPTVVVASIPAFLALTAFADAPDVRFVPAVPGTFTLSAVPLTVARYFLAAIPNVVVEKYAEIFRRAGLVLEKVELESAALARTSGADPEKTLIIDVGGRSTTFTVARSGIVEYIEQTDFAAASNLSDVILKKAEKIAADFQTKKQITCDRLSVTNGLIR